MRRVIYLFFSERLAREGGGKGGAARRFFPCSADHERDWPPCKVVFFGLATNALNVRNNNNSNNNCVLLQYWCSSSCRPILYSTSTSKVSLRRSADLSDTHSRHKHHPPTGKIQHQVLCGMPSSPKTGKQACEEAILRRMSSGGTTTNHCYTIKTGVRNIAAGVPQHSIFTNKHKKSLMVGTIV